VQAIEQTNYLAPEVLIWFIFFIYPWSITLSLLSHRSTSSCFICCANCNLQQYAFYLISTVTGFFFPVHSYPCPSTAQVSESFKVW
jgi:hypothetical protein